MAGVYIKGMEMPGSCGECRFLNPGNYKGKEYPCVCDVGDFLVKPSETDLRDGLCPLVEVPDHGDLIDRDEMLEKAGLCVSDFGTPDERWRPDRDWFLGINAMPTVIPAERRGE